MDLTKEETLKEWLSTLNNDTVTISSPSAAQYAEVNGWSDPHYGAVPPLTVSNIDGNINGTTYSNISLTGSPYTFGPDASRLGSNTVWTTNGTGSSPYTINPYTMNQSGKVHITGENADLVIGEKSMRDWMERVEERLNILHPNEKLETEWEELRALGEQYRQLEQHIKDKQATWDRLKAMPPPVTE
jgi:hypothetical protein